MRQDLRTPDRSAQTPPHPGVPAGVRRRSGRRLLAGLSLLLLLVTGLFALDLRDPEPAGAAVEDLIDCAPTSPYVYNLRSPDGTVGGERLNQVERINTDEGGESEVLYDFADEIPEQVNALGIGRDTLGRGRYLYFTTSNIGSRHGSGVAPDDQDVRNVYQYDLLTEELTATRIPNSIWRPDSNHIVRHGAVDYATGIYYFATSQSGTNAFSLIAYDPASQQVWLAGDIHTPGAVGDSGDMAFDSLGNLYFIVGSGSTAHLYTAEAGALPSAYGETADVTLTRTGGSAGVSGSNGVGVAYGHYGYLYVTFGNGQMHQVDPSTGRSLGTVTNLAPAQPGSPVGGGASTDLASCSAPSTLTVRKNVHSRADDGDQFQLDVWRDGSADDPVDEDDVHVGETATTEGSEDGIQQEQVGPVPILTLQPDETTPWNYTIRETASGRTDLADYETYYRCVDMNDSSFPQIDGVIEPQEGETYREFDLDIPSRATPGSRAIVCTFTNSPPGTPRIVKEADPGTPQEVLDDIEFTGTYRCEFTDDEGELIVNEGTWTAEGPGPARLTPGEGSELEVPVGSSCEVSEDELEQESLPDSSWSWNDPLYRSSDDPDADPVPGSATVTVTEDSTADGANTVWVRNGTPQATGELSVEKAVEGDPDWDDGIEFSGTWSCLYPGIDGIPGTDDDVVNTGTWAVTGTGPAQLTADSGSTTEVPVNSECTVEEDWPGDEGLPDETWRWNEPSYAPEAEGGGAGEVTISAEEENLVTVTNSAGGLGVEKVLAGGPEELEDLEYTGRYECTWDPEGSSGGTWAVTGEGAADLTPDSGAEAIPEGAQCTVTEDELDPDDLPEDWSWAAPVVDPVPLEIGPGENVATVTNQAVDEDGTFSVTKAVEDEQDAAPDAEFTFTWQCVTGDGTFYPSDPPGTFTLSDGQTWHSAEDGGLEIPSGAECTVTEEDPEAPGEGYAWTTETSVAGSEPAEGDEAVAVIPADPEDDHVEIGFTNTLTGSFGDFTVQKTLQPGDAPLPEGQDFDFTWQCTTPEGQQIPEEGAGEFSLTPGETWASAGADLQLPVGTVCSVEEGDPDEVEGYTWQVSHVVAGSSPELGTSAEIVISEGEEPAALEFINSLTDDFGSFQVSKTVVDEADLAPEDQEFSFTWQCELPGGGLLPGEEPGTFTLTHGQAYVVEPIPEGAACSVEEAAPESEQGIWETAVELDVEGGAAEGASAFFTIPEEDAAPAVGVEYTNTLTPEDEPSPTPTDPTDSPTPTEPTESPTPTEPTETPTEPTDSPTPTEPTETPTEPTESPTPTEPTDSPTPTEPTESPTPTEPTESPTPTDPTESPTPTEPTESPTPTEPTDSPTPTEPTETPTEPTESPTPTEPTDSPTPTEPTETPTEPTESPTPTEPTDSPTPTEPTETPTPTEPTETPPPTDPTESPTPTEPTEEPSPTEPTDTPTPTEPTETPAPSPTVTATETVDPAAPPSPSGEADPSEPGAEPTGPEDPGQAVPPEGTAPPQGGMPQTGAAAGILTLAALALIAAGTALTFWVRRRET